MPYPPGAGADLVLRLVTVRLAASLGFGGPHYILVEWLKLLSGMDLLHVPYAGSAPALNAAIAGHSAVLRRKAFAQPRRSAGGSSMASRMPWRRSKCSARARQYSIVHCCSSAISAVRR